MNSSSGSSEFVLECLRFKDCADKCACARSDANSTEEGCRNDAGFFNYAIFNYCTMGGLLPLSLIILILWLLVLFYLLVTTTKQYFCPSLSKLSKRLRLSNNVAGVTFLAFSNGAPDLFSAISAFAHSADTLGASFLLGSGVFVTLLVLGIVFVVSPPVKLTRRPFLRDVIFYLVAVCAFFGIVMDKQVYLWESGLFITFYLIYVIGVFAARYTSQKLKKKKREALGIIEDSGEELFEKSADMADDAMPLLDDLLNTPNNRSWAPNRYDPRRPSIKSINSEDEPMLQAYNDDNDDEFMPKKKEQTLVESLKEGWFRALSAIGWAELRLFDKLALLLLWPIAVLRSITVPCAGPEGLWSRPLAVISPITVPLLVLVSLKEYNAKLVISSTGIPVWAIVLVIGFIFALVAFFTTTNNEPPRYLMVFVLLGFIGSTVWMYLFATEIIALVRTFGRIFDLSESIMGLTVVAWATSIVDIVSNFIVSKQGFADMAVGACFGAPTFALLLGVGLSVTYKNLLNYPNPLRLRFTGHMWVGFLFLVISIVSTGIFIPVNGFNTSRRYGFFLFALYIAFGTLSILLEIGLNIPFLS